MKFIDVLFDGPPGPEGGRFVEVEDELGHSIVCGSWVERPGGLWAMRIPMSQLEEPRDHSRRNREDGR